MNPFWRFPYSIVLLIIIGLSGVGMLAHGAPSPQLLIALALASSLMARSVAYLDIFEWLRKPFIKFIPHSSGVGEDAGIITTNHPIARAFGELISCINCAGMWAAALMLLLYEISPSIGGALIYTMAAASLGILLTRVLETVEWKKCLLQEETGEKNRLNKNVINTKADLTHDELYIKLRTLANACYIYREMHDFMGDGSIEAGRAWVAMRNASDAAINLLESGHKQS
jgi:hypothetical protein